MQSTTNVPRPTCRRPSGATPAICRRRPPPRVRRATPSSSPTLLIAAPSIAGATPCRPRPPTARGARRGSPDSASCRRAAAPGKRPRLTPNPAIAVRDDGSVIPFGAPGGDVQVQAMLQVFLNTFHFGMDIQEAIEQPRFATFSFPNSFAPYTHLPGRLNIEARLPPATLEELRRRGHDVEMWPALTRPPCSVEAILLDSTTGFLRAGGDFRQPAYAMVS